MKKTNTRKENDSLGQIEVPINAYFGACTARALKNFQISKLTAPQIFRKAIGYIKLAAIKTNSELKLIPAKEAKAIEKACEEFIKGNFDNEFILDVFQAGAGTSYNMNANEIIANRANELLGSKKGTYKFVNPNNDVNMAQSTNDVIPTATRIAILLLTPALLTEIQKLEKEIEILAKKHRETIKVARTHLQDAVPISLGQEFDSYKEAIRKSREFIIQQSEDLKIISIGGTAVGTAINTHPKYQELMIQNLKKLTGINYKPAKNLTELSNNMNSFLNFSASIKSAAVNFLNMCSDLKIMNMGPKAGISEINLPEVQEGSSIMPGKLNPSILECLEMVCLQILGNDRVIELGAQKSNFELNTTCPLIMHNLIQSIEILTNAVRTFRELAIKNLRVNTEKIKDLFNKSLCTATAISPFLGYQKTAEIVKSALKNNTSIKEEILKQKLLSEKELNEIIKNCCKTSSY